MIQPSRSRVVDGTTERRSPQVCVLLLCVWVLTQLFSLHSSCCIAKAPALQRRNTKSVCRLQRVKACPSSNTTCSPEPKDSPPHWSVSRAQVVTTNTHKLYCVQNTSLLFLICIFSPPFSNCCLWCDSQLQRQPDSHSTGHCQWQEIQSGHECKVSATDTLHLCLNHQLL